MGYATAIAVASLLVAGGSAAASADQNRKARHAREDYLNKQANDNADAYAEDARRHIASMKAGFAAAGFATDSGSPLSVLLESANTAQDEEQRIREGWAQGYSFEDSTLADSLDLSATLLDKGGKVYSAGVEEGVF